MLAADIGSHDNDGVFEVHGTALSVGQAAVIQYLQQDVEHVGMGLFHFVQKNHAVRFAADLFGQVAALFVADIARRRADQACNGVFFHVFGHIDTNQMIFAVEQEACQSFAQLGFTHAGRA